MNRRLFFQSLLGGAVALHELDIEELLWVPGKKTIFTPPARLDYSGLIGPPYTRPTVPDWAVYEMIYPAPDERNLHIALVPRDKLQNGLFNLSDYDVSDQ